MDAMVTGRLPVEKKKRGNEIIARLGTTPSRLIAELYDYIISEEKLPDLTLSRADLYDQSQKAKVYRAFLERTTLEMPQGFWDSNKSDEERLTEALEEKYGPVA